MAIYYISTKILITRSLIYSDRQTSIKTYNIIFHKNPSTWSRVPCGLLATYDIANSRFPPFCEWTGRTEHCRYCTLHKFLFFYFLDFYSCSVIGGGGGGGPFFLALSLLWGPFFFPQKKKNKLRTGGKVS